MKDVHFRSAQSVEEIFRSSVEANIGIVVVITTAMYVLDV